MCDDSPTSSTVPSAKVATRISEISIGASERSTSISIDLEMVG